MNTSVPVAPTDEQERPEPPFDPGRVEEMLRQLDKTVRAHQLYLRNNPTYLKSLELLRAAFVGVWAETEAITIQVTDSEFKWYGITVHVHAEKASDSLPWTLFKDGLREFTLTAGFEEAEIEALLDIIPRVRKAQDHEDDLLTLLWEREFTHLTYRYIDVSSEPGLPIDPGAEAGRWPVTPGIVVEDPKLALDELAGGADADRKPGGNGGEAAAESPSGVVRMEEFDSTLYFLDADEIDYLRSETEREYATDVRQLVINSLLDILEGQSEPTVRQEVAQHLGVITLHLLAARHFASVAHLLRELSTTLERVQGLPPDVRSKLEQLPDRLSEPQALSQLIEAMDAAESLPGSEDLADLFGQLRPAALGTVLSWLRLTQNAKLKPLLEAAAERLAQSNTAELVRLIGAEDAGVAMEAVRRAGGLKAQAAVPALAKALGLPDREFRVTAVAALVEIGTPSAMQVLEKALEDPERDVRVTAVKALAQRAYKPALPRVSHLVKAKEIRDVDRTERVALFELFGTICGDSGVPYLDDLLNSRGGLFSRKEHPDIRACAAIALGKVGTTRAEDALQKALAEKDVIVRSAVSRALRTNVP
ncbi:MAG TPA: HEAT repeat domain-containing protein [Gemmatimonadaceae bacterium]|nr:HEAT repeat domain-containing protein [Gemmatimonadaceae bacterium]